MLESVILKPLRKTIACVRVFGAKFRTMTRVYTSRARGSTVSLAGISRCSALTDSERDTWQDTIQSSVCFDRFV